MASHKTYTNAFTLTDDVKPNPEVGGYDQEVIALISPNCISACDGMALLLEKAGRAKVIGTTTNGTGAGFIGSAPFDNVQMRDRNQVVSLRIPNRMFGPGGEIGRHVFDEADAYLKYNSENRPVVAPQQYVETLEDFTDKSAGWYRTALEALTN